MSHNSNSTRTDSAVDGAAGAVAAEPWPLRWVIITVACVFGPYLVGGVRTEQAALYGSALVGALLLRRHYRGLLPGWPVLGLWLVYAATAAIGALFIESELPWGSGSVVAGLDNAFLPLATMTVVAIWMRLLPGPVLLNTVCTMIAVAMAINALIAVLTAFVGFDGVPLLDRFWAAGGSGTTVAELAAGNGRYSGVFNQPAEAGVAYTLAAVCLIFVLRSGATVPRRVWIPVWALIIVGGLLTLSKIFIVGGVLLSGFLIITGRPQRISLAMTAAVTGLGTFMLGGLGWLGTWGASGMLGWYAESARSGDSLAYTLSAGRFGRGSEEPPGGGTAAGSPSASTDPIVPDASDEGGIPTEFEQPGGLIELGREVFGHHPFFGLGAGGAPVSYDSTWVEALIVAGSVGVLCVLAVHVFLVVRWIRLRGVLSREEWRLAGSVALLACGSSFGMPSLTGNRESSLMWILLSLLVVFRAHSDASGRTDLDRDGPPAGRQETKGA